MRPTQFQGLTQDQMDILAAVNNRVSSADLHKSFGDRFQVTRVRGVLMQLQLKRLVENKGGEWVRTEAGDRKVQKAAKED